MKRMTELTLSWSVQKEQCWLEEPLIVTEPLAPDGSTTGLTKSLTYALLSEGQPEVETKVFEARHLKSADPG